MNLKGKSGHWKIWCAVIPKNTAEKIVSWQGPGHVVREMQIDGAIALVGNDYFEVAYTDPCNVGVILNVESQPVEF